MLTAFLSSHFELIVAFQVYLMIGMVVIILVLQVRSIRLPELQAGLRQVLYFLIVIGETGLLVSIIYVYASNISPKPTIDFSSRILPSTRWVKDNKTTVYFIDGNQLVSVRPDSSERTIVFDRGGVIRSYYFSPDGKDLLIVTEGGLFLYNIQSKTADLIEALNQAEMKKADIQGTIGGVRFSPDGSRVSYRMAKWSSFASQDSWYVYDRVKKEKRKIVSPTLSFSSLIWDKSGDPPPDPRAPPPDPTAANPYKVKVYRIPLPTLMPEIAVQFNFDKPELSSEHLSARGIDLDFSLDPISFSREAKSRYSTRSAKGSLVAIDDDDILYYVRSRWWRKRLYQIPRVPINSDIERYQYQGGQLAVQDLRWLPGGRYVIMEHYFFGILILDPATGQIGILDNQRGDTFGWYEEIK